MQKRRESDLFNMQLSHETQIFKGLLELLLVKLLCQSGFRYRSWALDLLWNTHHLEILCWTCLSYQDNSFKQAKHLRRVYRVLVVLNNTKVGSQVSISKAQFFWTGCMLGSIKERSWLRIFNINLSMRVKKAILTLQLIMRVFILPENLSKVRYSWVFIWSLFMFCVV